MNGPKRSADALVRHFGVRRQSEASTALLERVCARRRNVLRHAKSGVVASLCHRIQTLRDCRII